MSIFRTSLVALVATVSVSSAAFADSVAFDINSFIVLAQGDYSGSIGGDVFGTTIKEDLGKVVFDRKGMNRWSFASNANGGYTMEYSLEGDTITRKDVYELAPGTVAPQAKVGKVTHSTPTGYTVQFADQTETWKILGPTELLLSITQKLPVDSTAGVASTEFTVSGVLKRDIL